MLKLFIVHWGNKIGEVERGAMSDGAGSRNRVLPLNEKGRPLYRVEVDAKVPYAGYDPIK
jgi:hypothetical protein